MSEEKNEKEEQKEQPTVDTAAENPTEAPKETTEETPVDVPAEAEVEEETLEAEVISIPELRPGMTIRVHQKITEGDKERIQIFQGMIIALRGKTPETKTVTVQKRSFGVLVEKIFPLASPLIEKIEVVKKARVRRSKLYFLRGYTKRLKETLVQE